MSTDIQPHGTAAPDGTPKQKKPQLRNNKLNHPATPQGNPVLVVIPKSATTQKNIHQPFLHMDQYNIPNAEELPQTAESTQVLTLKDYLEAVNNNKLPKGPNHKTLEELARKPGALNETKVIVLSYSQSPAPPKST